MKDPSSILITGASSGIGEALALYYAAHRNQGVRLFLSGRNKDRLDKVCQRCKAQGAVVEGRIIDVTDRSAMADWISGLDELDLVIANAGISGGSGGRREGEPIEEARTIFNVNVTGVLNTIEPALKKMRTRHPVCGQIAIVSSLVGFRGWPSSPAYSASKGTVRFYGEALRGALKDTGIAVNVICPGFVTSRMTDINEFSMPMKMSAKKAATIIAKGLEKNKGRICFPWPMHFISWLIGALPDALAQKILANAPDKAAVIKEN